MVTALCVTSRRGQRGALVRVVGHQATVHFDDGAVRVLELRYLAPAVEKTNE